MSSVTVASCEASEARSRRGGRSWRAVALLGLLALTLLGPLGSGNQALAQTRNERTKAARAAEATAKKEPSYGLGYLVTVLAVSIGFAMATIPPRRREAVELEDAWRG